jgi:hypothetical protein
LLCGPARVLFRLELCVNRRILSCSPIAVYCLSYPAKTPLHKGNILALVKSTYCTVHNQRVSAKERPRESLQSAVLLFSTPHLYLVTPLTYFATPPPNLATSHPYLATPHPNLATPHPHFATPTPLLCYAKPLLFHAIPLLCYGRSPTWLRYTPPNYTTSLPPPCIANQLVSYATTTPSPSYVQYLLHIYCDAKQPT